MKDKRAVIVCHAWVYGPPQALRDYLLKNGVKELLLIGHQNLSMPNNPVRSSYAEYYRGGKLVRTLRAPEWSLPEPIAYMKDCLYTWYWTVTLMKGKVDYFFGVGNLNAFVGLLLRMLGLTRRVIYYVIDYIPHRFDNSIMNTIYHRVEYLSARFSDTTWNYSGIMGQMREKKWKRKFHRQLVAPNGITIYPSAQVSWDNIDKHELIYFGSIRMAQGIQIVIEAIPKIQKSIPDIHFTVIGRGADTEALRALVQKRFLKKAVTFLDTIPDPEDLDKRLSVAALGTAMYDPEGGFVQYGEPGKVKRYLSCSVPVVMTDISSLAKQLEKNRCGMVSPYRSDAFAKLAVSFLKNPAKMRRYRENARKYSEKFTWDKIFKRAMVNSAIF